MGTWIDGVPFNSAAFSSCPKIFVVLLPGEELLKVLSGLSLYELQVRRLVRHDGSPWNSHENPGLHTFLVQVKAIGRAISKSFSSLAGENPLVVAFAAISRMKGLEQRPF